MIRTLLTVVTLLASILLTGCQRREEFAVGEALNADVRAQNWSSISCDKAQKGVRSCVVKFEWWDDSTSKIKVQVESAGFHDDEFDISWSWQEYQRYWRVGFSTSIDLKQRHRDEILPWLVSQLRLVGAQAEIVGKDELATARKRQEIWQSYRR